MATRDAERSRETKLDLTPMIDCVFLLIIFFFCIEFRSPEAIRRHPTTMVPNPSLPSRMRVLPVTIRPGAGTVYADVAATIDIVRASGFDDVFFAAKPRRR